jgi:hypothetical protein
MQAAANQDDQTGLTQIETDIGAIAAAMAAMRAAAQFPPPIDFGTASAGGAGTLTDAAKDWPVNAFGPGTYYNFAVRIVAGTGAGQFRIIASNTANELTVATNWTTPPAADSSYLIFNVGA